MLFSILFFYSLYFNDFYELQQIEDAEMDYLTVYAWKSEYVNVINVCLFTSGELVASIN